MNEGYPDIKSLLLISVIFHVTIDSFIHEDEAFQEKIVIDDDHTFEQFSDPGFYLGIALLFVGDFAG